MGKLERLKLLREEWIQSKKFLYSNRRMSIFTIGMSTLFTPIMALWALEGGDWWPIHVLCVLLHIHSVYDAINRLYKFKDDLKEHEQLLAELDKEIARVEKQMEAFK